MNRSAFRTWLVFGACVGLALVAVASISRLVLRLEREGAEARRLAAVEENVRLALWRIDSAVAILTAQENVRPDDSFDASPTEAPGRIRLRFSIDASGQIPDTATPPSPWRAQAASLAPLLAAKVRNPAPAKLSQTYELSQSDNSYVDNSVSEQRPKSQAEYNSRSNNAQMAYQWPSRLSNFPRQGPKLAATKAAPDFDPRPEGVLTPLWLNHELFLARAAHGRVEAVWLDWPELSAWLTGVIRDLLPNATLTPMVAPDAGATQQLAALPIRLVPGALPVRDEAGGAPAWLILAIAWIGVSVASGAIGVLLFGTLALSERRGAFVSAVTHELRTPLTTFRIYTEMLSEGMVREEAQRVAYLTTLRHEAERLSHLVENVLSYSRVEQGRTKTLRTPVAMNELLERITGRLSERALQSAALLVIEAEPIAVARTVLADGAAVEQILFNLVDNACKYAATAADRRIHLTLRLHRSRILITVRDHGPGLAREAKRSLFVPFSKPASQAAISAPGVGLGLALCRGLARNLGGELTCEESSSEGTTFRLTLRVAKSA